MSLKFTNVEQTRKKYLEEKFIIIIIIIIGRKIYKRRQPLSYQMESICTSFKKITQSSTPTHSLSPKCMITP
jgi:hypothetical protein